ncbi:zinc-ribbon domain containing protein [Calycomorphotria hydatis]|uniref:Probable zinc-binding domain-containing protein n=1 Tax=Calycomorphotria hydatis TaxID=2528027 RepID=A0A517TBV6_9PLAN|nr:zinc-ribbon domain containing protein [Calycomorphotria hydatis]QDT65851.1 hypothetical protein V22_31130 [Calycomorphotria hydatis]
MISNNPNNVPYKRRAAYKESDELRALLANLVPHPRFTTLDPRQIEPLKAKEREHFELVRQSFWRYTQEILVPKTDIPADLSKQSHATIPCNFYIDLIKTCISCTKRFIFFAQEQKYWYEDLGYPLDADCVRCAPCRKKSQRTKSATVLYAKYRAHQLKNTDTFQDVIGAVLHLWSEGVLKKQEPIRELNRQAKDSIPDHINTIKLEKLCETFVKPNA